LHPINLEWGESLVDIQMVVLVSWWPGYSGINLCLGKILKFDPTSNPPFLLKVNNEPGDFYAMQYDAIQAYIQADHVTFLNFRLPDTAPKESALENRGVVQRRCRRCCCSRGTRRRGQPPSPMYVLQAAPGLANGNRSSKNNDDDDDNNSDRNNDPNDRNKDDGDDREVIVVGHTDVKD
jgi:hypothetical protein